MGLAARKARRTARALSTNRYGDLAPASEIGSSMEKCQQRKARSAANAATRTSASPFPREPDSLCAPFRRAILGRSSGSWASACADLLGVASQAARPSAIHAVRSQLPLRGSPGIHAAITARSPGSLFSLLHLGVAQYLGQAPRMDTRYCGSWKASTTPFAPGTRLRPY